MIEKRLYFRYNRLVKVKGENQCRRILLTKKYAFKKITEDERMTITDEIKKRRTFAIISHPDAGKTTITLGVRFGKLVP